MKHHLFTIAIILSLLIVVVIVGADYLLLRKHSETQEYVSSLDSKYCYLEGTENKNIKYPVYYPSLVSCGKPLK